jgi:glucokinase
MKHFVGIDVGATRIKAGLVNEQCRVLNEHVVWLDEADRSEDGVVARIVEAVGKARDDRSVLSVGLGIAGCVDAEKGTVVTSPNFPEWRNFEVAKRLGAFIDVPVLVDNDANCVIAGEFLAGAAIGRGNLLGFTLGTGVGGALILNGRLWRGVHGMAGEFGHIVVEPNGPLCGCGSHGCLEMYCSLVGFKQLCDDAPVDGVDSRMANLPEQLADAAMAGNTAAVAHFETAGTMLGRALAGLLHTLNVDTVVLAGGVSHTFDWMKDAMRKELQQRCYPVVADAVTIRVGTLGDQAGILGAAMQWKLQGL